MNKKQIIGGVVALVVVGGASFYGGMSYANNQTPTRGAGTFTRGVGAAGAGGTFTGRGGAGGATVGQVISQDSTGITL